MLLQKQRSGSGPEFYSTPGKVIYSRTVGGRFLIVNLCDAFLSSAAGHLVA